MRLSTISFDLGGPQRPFAVSGAPYAATALDGFATGDLADPVAATIVAGRTNDALRMDSLTGLQAAQLPVRVGAAPLEPDPLLDPKSRIARFYVAFEDLPAADTVGSFLAFSGLTLYVDSDGRLIYRHRTGLSSGEEYGPSDAGCPVEGGRYLASAPAAVDTWLRLEMAVHGATGTARGFIAVRVDGVIVAKRCAAKASIGYGDEAILGWREVWPAGENIGAGKGVLFDDGAINDEKGGVQDTWPGPGRVYACRPTSAGGSYPWAAGSLLTTAGGVEAGTIANECDPTTGPPPVICTGGDMAAPLARRPPVPIGVDPEDDAHRCDYADREVVCGASDWWKDLQPGPVCAFNYTAARQAGAGETLDVTFEAPADLGAAGVVTLMQQRLVSYRNEGAGDGIGDNGDGIEDDPALFRLTANPVQTTPVLGEHGYIVEAGPIYRNFGEIQLGPVLYAPALTLADVIEGEYVKVAQMRLFGTSLHYAGRLPWSLVTTNVIVETGAEAQPELPNCGYVALV